MAQTLHVPSLGSVIVETSSSGLKLSKFVSDLDYVYLFGGPKTSYNQPSSGVIGPLQPSHILIDRCGVQHPHFLIWGQQL